MWGPPWHYEEIEGQRGEVILSKSLSKQKGRWDAWSGLRRGRHHMSALGCLEKEGMWPSLVAVPCV